MPAPDRTIGLEDATPVLRLVRSPGAAVGVRVDLLAALARLTIGAEVRDQVAAAIRAEFNRAGADVLPDVVISASLLRDPDLNPLLARHLTQVDRVKVEDRLTIAMALAWSDDLVPLENLLRDVDDNGAEYDIPFYQSDFSVLRWFAPLPGNVADQLPGWQDRYRGPWAGWLLTLLDHARAEPATAQPPSQVSVDDLVRAGGSHARDLLARDPTLAEISREAQPLAVALTDRLLTRACAMLDDCSVSRECSQAAVRLAGLLGDSFEPDYERLFALFRHLTSPSERFDATEYVRNGLGIIAGQGSSPSLVAHTAGWLSAVDDRTIAAAFLRLAATMRGPAWQGASSDRFYVGGAASAVGAPAYSRRRAVFRTRGLPRRSRWRHFSFSIRPRAIELEFPARASPRVEGVPPRLVSTGFATLRDPWRPRRPGSPLRPGRRYLFWFEIGAAVEGAIDVEPIEAPLDNLPQDALLEVVLFSLSRGLTVDPATASQSLVLAADGSVRRADAPPVGEEPNNRRLLFRVRAPFKPGVARLRCNLYHENFLLQSRVITANVRPARRNELFALQTRVDYSLTTSLSPALISDIPGHSLSILINEDDDATHGFYFYGGPGLSCNIRLDKVDLATLLSNARAALRTASWGSGSEWVDTAEYRYGTADPDKRLTLLQEDLCDLARSGARLWDRLARDFSGSKNSADPRALEKQLRMTMRQSGRVQVVTRRDTRLVVPAALLYDYPLDDPLLKPELCPQGMDAVRSGDADAMARHSCFNGQCPHYDDYTTVCPGGFWGFRHEIGLPVSQAVGTDGCSEIASTIVMGSCARWTVGVSTDPRLTRRLAHQEILEELRTPVDWRLGEEVRTLLGLFSSTEPHVVYLLCHGGVTRDNTPYVEVGAPGVAYFTPSTLTRRDIRWPQTRPLVVLNGCHTTDLAPEKQLEFVTAFVQYCSAAGVIGTEITVFEDVACDFAQEMMRRLLKDELPLGAAVKGARLALLAKLNPLGLVYTAFAQVGLQYHGGEGRAFTSDSSGH